jgi:6 kDa early secretory antigenic target
MTRFEVDAARVDAASAQVRATSQTLTAEVEAMVRHLEDLQGVWRGQAASGFAQLTAQWRATQNQVRDALDAIHVALGQAGRQYADTETATARLFQG